MEIEILRKYKPLLTSEHRYVLLFGGRAAGRSHAASQRVVLDTISKPYSRAAVMRHILSDVKSSIWQDTKDRLEDIGLPEANDSLKYNYNGNLIDGKGFKKSSSQNSAKLKSLAGYNLVVIEEADEINEEDFNQLDTTIRTQKATNQLILCFNMPHKDHWIIKRWFNLEASEIEGYYNAIPKDAEDTLYIEANYHDNRINLPQSAVNTFERFKEVNPEYYYTMIKGLVSEGVRGRVFKDWKTITDNEYNELPYTVSYGLDFGFTNDPAALVEIKVHNDKIYLKELLYETNLTNQDLIQRFKTLGVKGSIIADSAEPKSIEEIKRGGFLIKPSVKGPDSIRQGIGILRAKEVHYTESSHNLAIEVQNYTYKLDRSKNPTNDPIDEFNHALDAVRYGVQDRVSKPSLKLTFV